jgi:hypothetical protein
VDTTSSLVACGGCGQACPVEASCQAGQCVCPGGETACGYACIDTATSPSHCGGCDQSCAPGQACVGGQCTCVGGAASLSGDVQPMFASSCLGNGCHDAASMAANLSLVGGVAHAELVGVVADQCNGTLLVEAGAPQLSYLVHKLTGLEICNGSQMPKQAPPLSWAEVDAVSRWICADAPDD